MNKNNLEKFHFSRFDKNKYNGDGIHIVLIDEVDEKNIDHGDKSEAVAIEVASYCSLGTVKGVTTHMVPFGLPTYTKLQKVKELYENGKCHILSISAHGFKLDTKDTAELYNYLADRVFIIAASGNTYGTEYNYPASGDKCLSVSACDCRNGTVPYWLSYSTRNDRVDVGNFSNLYVTVFNQVFSFGGTSCATPYTAGMVSKIMQWFKEAYGRIPNYKEVNSILFNFCKKVYKENKLLDTPNIYVGNGIPVMPLNFYPSWCSIHLSFLEENFGISHLVKRGKSWISNEYLTSSDFNEKVDRGTQISILGKLLSGRNGLSYDAYNKICSDNGMNFMSTINGVDGMYYDNFMTRAEEVAFLSKAKLALMNKNGIIAEIKDVDDAWILNYLKERSSIEKYEESKNMWYWKYYKFFNENIGILDSFNPNGLVTFSEDIKMLALTFGYK